MKKAVVIGGSNGIGAAIARGLMDRGYEVCILDIAQPDREIFHSGEAWTYYPFDLTHLDLTLAQQLSADPEVAGVMLTAGFGRVAAFQDLHTAEIEKLLTVNTVSTIRLIRQFYDRIRGAAPFFCGVMGSIAGLCSSPLFSVYAASKAAICRFTESVNIELEAAGTDNRILNVSPGSLAGTRFNGGSNQLSQMAGVAEQILEALLQRQTLLIPNQAVYGDVLRRYQADPHAFGMESYAYKQASGRVQQGKKVCVGYLSGTFDLFHVGHLNLLRRAKAQCDHLIVGVHPDASHKGKQTVIPFDQRMEVVGGIRYVDQVVPACREDSDAWQLWQFDRLFVGSDYQGTERFARYEAFFADKGVQIIYFPYTQSTSSTQIREKITSKSEE